MTASVLLRKQPSYSEVYNDLDGDLVNLLCILRDEDQRNKLIIQLKLTPYSRAEFEQSYLLSENNIENARRTIVRSFMGFGSAATNRNHVTGFRGKSHRTTSNASSDWFNYPDALHTIGERLRGVIIERKNAFDLIQYHDSHETLFYADPPYLHQTRHQGAGRCYQHEMNNKDHEHLLLQLRALKGFVVLSGYDNELYNDYLLGWGKKYKTASADGHGKRTEVLWIKSPDQKDRMRQGAYQTHKKRTDSQETKIIASIDLLRSEGNKKISKARVASLVGLSREQLSRRYGHLF